ncbi:MAG TPA: condensation domain-containing protein, partial [Pyrinomonadaceae bacterium]|nr:condensation domain-containing protein [Pyrinomonadaceae bacterium]
MVTENIAQRKEQISQLRSRLSESGRGVLEKRLQAALNNGAQEETIPRREQDGPVCLSFLQQGIWITEQLQPGTAAYNVPTVVRLQGPLDLAALRSSFDEILRRHESLRSSFVVVDGEPSQVVAETVLIDLAVDDLTHLPEESKEPAARQRAKEEIHRPFDLTETSLFRARLLKLGDDDHVLIMVLHHIVSDVWSMGILFRELSTLYSAYSQNQIIRLPELPVQYPDFAVWQRNHLQGELLDENLDYWKRQLAEAPPMLELPTDHPRPQRLSGRGVVEVFTLPEPLSEGLRQLSLKEGTTLFMTMLAAFQLLLSRYSNQDDVVVGCDTAGRNRAELEGLIGFFVNTLAMRTSLAGDPSFVELLARVKETCLGAFAHQNLPFERLVAELQPDRASNYSPIFQVMFSLQSRQQQRAQEGNWNGLRVSGFRAKAETAMFDMSVRV